jgi:hypothetical protein
MDTSKKAWPISSMYGIRAAINTNPDYQRPAVWSSSQKQLLGDSILRGYDVPKFYWQQVSNKPVSYDVVDGQQRIWAICEFCDDKYGLVPTRHCRADEWREWRGRVQEGDGGIS